MRRQYIANLNKPYYLNVLEYRDGFQPMPSKWLGADKRNHAVKLRKDYCVKEKLLDGFTKTLKIVSGTYFQ